jgi:diamine N-acetyltransferase
MSGPGIASPVTLRKVTPGNFEAVIGLAVSPEQEDAVSSNLESLAEAYVHDGLAWVRAVYADETPVGFVMLDIDTVSHSYGVWRFMIDARFQKLGFGGRAMDLVIEHVKTLPGAEAITLSCVPGENGPGGFYERIGFTATGEMDDDEAVMRMML